MMPSIGDLQKKLQKSSVRAGILLAFFLTAAYLYSEGPKEPELQQVSVVTETERAEFTPLTGGREAAGKVQLQNPFAGKDKENTALLQAAGAEEKREECREKLPVLAEPGSQKLRAAGMIGEKGKRSAVLEYQGQMMVLEEGETSADITVLGIDSKGVRVNIRGQEKYLQF